MISKHIANTHFPILRETIHELAKFAERAQEPGPHYHSFLRTLTNSIQPMLGIAMVLSAGGDFRAECKITKASFDFAIPDDEIWGHFMDLVHRSFYSTFGIVLEAMCKGYCESRGRTVIASRPPRPPEFGDYLNSALRESKLTDARKSYWRTYFEGVRVLRNKSSHYDASFTSQEKETLQRASLGQHVGANGTMRTQPFNYIELANKALDFIRELENP